MPNLDHFGLALEKNYCNIWNHLPLNCLIAKFGVKIIKSSNLGLKITDLGIFGLEFEHITAIFEIIDHEFF